MLFLLALEGVGAMRHVRTDVDETPAFKLERTVPTHLTPGEPFDVELRLTSKVPLGHFAIREGLPDPLQVVQGETLLEGQDLRPDDQVSLRYQARSDEAFAGTLELVAEGAVETGDDQALKVGLNSILSTGFVYEASEDTAVKYERWVTPACTGPTEGMGVAARITTKKDLRDVHVAEVIPEGFRLVGGDLSLAARELRGGESLALSYSLAAATEEGLHATGGKATAMSSEGSHALELTATACVYGRLVIDSLQDPVWGTEVRDRLIAVVNPRQVNQHAFLAHAIRFMREFLNVELTAPIQRDVARSFDFGGAGVPLSHQDYEATLQGEKLWFGMEGYDLVDPAECEEAFDDQASKETPAEREAERAPRGERPVRAGEPGAAEADDPPFSAGFDTVLQLHKDALNAVSDAYLAGLRARGEDSVDVGLRFLGTLNATVTDVQFLSIHNGASGGDVLADIQMEFALRVTGGLGILLRGRGPGSLTVKDIGVELTKTPGGLPSGLQIILTQVEAGELVVPRFRGILGLVVNRLVPPLVRVGMWLLSRYIRRVRIPFWELADGMSSLGASFSSGAPVLDTVGDQSLVVASEFNPDQRPAGTLTPDEIRASGMNVGVTFHERLADQAVAIAVAKGWLPTGLRWRRFRISLQSISVSFEDGTIIVRARATVKRRGCLCGVKARVRLKIDARVWVEEAATAWIPADHVPALVMDWKAEVRAHISTWGWVALLATIVTPVVALVVNSIVVYLIDRGLVLPNLLRVLLPGVKSSIEGVQPPDQFHRLSVAVQTTPIPFVIYFGLSLNLFARGENYISLREYTTTQMFGQPLNVTLGRESVVVKPETLRLSVKL